MIHIKRGLGTAALALAALAALTAPAAHATDNVPCHRTTKKDLTDPATGRVWRGTDVMYCNLTRGHVPVYATRSPNAPIVGYLEQGGDANWFVTEMKGETFRDGAAENYWWGSTMADDGRWGWVPEVYFAGGENNEDDAGLLMPGGHTCAGVCPPLPFWAR
ncbi:hypothetical protein [Streptomyces griseorubiginosus]|uniref:hypothetical protein n=1 Tax=Streptomyces griseorubiginosus TaxID=67304 RepID=UPI001AD6CDC2|nr:hypothetical protein [Streptomyces griseorubiginosus]MBO4259575.1 hypothetical protein [Streptomyces griseorubiginosus]